MPRSLPGESTFDTLEEEVLYTEAALGADEDASDLLTATATWMARIDAARIADRAVRAEVVTVEALRQVADRRLDSGCSAFGDELYLSCGKDRESPRWRQFFPEPVSKFIRKALPAQVLSVQGWLVSTDPVFLRHKTTLSKWVTAADSALVRSRSLTLRRGENRTKRDELCRALTAERDTLHAALVTRAVDRKLPRDWPDGFFRIHGRPSKEEDDKKSDAAQSGASPVETRVTETKITETKVTETRPVQAEEPSPPAESPAPVSDAA